MRFLSKHRETTPHYIADQHQTRHNTQESKPRDYNGESIRTSVIDTLPVIKRLEEPWPRETGGIQSTSPLNKCSTRHAPAAIATPITTPVTSDVPLAPPGVG
ncbi:hypothetical protein Trydic_g11304 [Trypoxylus dichotomus]